MHNNAQKTHNFRTPFFIATVVNATDPTLSYRIQVRIPELHPDTLDDKDLPWAAKVDSSFMGVNTETDLLHSIPEVGTKVLVLTVSDDPNSLVYLGSLYTKQNATPNSERYNQTYGIYTQKGEFIGVEKIAHVFHMIWSGDLTFDVEGKIKLGTNASQQAVLGNYLVQQLNSIIGVFNTHSHTGNLGMPTSTPATEMKLQNVLSDKVTLE